MVSMNSLHKSGRKLSVIALGILIVAIASTSYAKDNGEFWVELGNGPVKNMAEVEVLVGGLIKDMQNKAMICIDEGRYLVVHADSGTQEEAAQLREQLQLNTKIVQIPGNQCFAANNFLKQEVASKPDFPRPPRKDSFGSDTNPTRLVPSFANTDRAKAKIAHAPKVLDNTTVKVLPEVTTQINLSSRDVNRITCSGNRPVKDIVFSSEKGVSPKIAGNNVFIKFLVEQDTATGEIQLSTTPTEMYVVCGAEGTIYSLITIPRDIPAQTVELTTSIDKVSKNLSLFKGLSFEKKVLTIVKQAYKASYPESYTIKRTNQPIDALASVGIEVTLVQEVEVEGEGLRIKQYHLNLVPDFQVDEIKVMEKYFLLPTLTDHPVAIAMDTQFIRKIGHTRLIILEQPEMADL